MGTQVSGASEIRLHTLVKHQIPFPGEQLPPRPTLTRCTQWQLCIHDCSHCYNKRTQSKWRDEAFVSTCNSRVQSTAARKAQWEEHEPSGHRCIHSQRQNKRDEMSFFLFTQLSQPREQRHPYSGWVFPSQLIQSRNQSQACLEVSLLDDFRSCQLDYSC